MQGERRSKAKAFLIPGFGLVLSLALVAVWIWRSGSVTVHEATHGRGWQPALLDRLSYDSDEPYQIINSSWGGVPQSSAETEVEDENEAMFSGGKPPPLAGLDVAVSDS